MINVLYHANCMDGLASAAIALDVLKNKCNCIPVNYGEPFPYDKLKLNSDIDKYIILILDFSYPLDLMEELETNKHIKIDGVLDHHNSVDIILKNKPYFLFDNNKSGAALTWEWFHPHTAYPDYVQFVQDRDLWRWKWDKSKEYNTGLTRIPKNNPQAFLDFLIDNQTWDIISSGEAILDYQESEIQLALQHRHVIKVGGYEFLAVNNTVSTLTSEIGHRLAKYTSLCYGAVYFFNPIIKKYVISLRSWGDVDVSSIAKSFGGGGHKNAAGFSVDSIEVIS